MLSLSRFLNQNVLEGYQEHMGANYSTRDISQNVNRLLYRNHKNIMERQAICVYQCQKKHFIHSIYCQQILYVYCKGMRVIIVSID